MSDGPHKSLPMRRYWKTVAERAATEAYSIDQVCEALPYALNKDLREAPLDVIRDILGGGEQAPLFFEESIRQLETLRIDCRGSAISNTLLDCAVQVASTGGTGDNAYLSVLENALAGYTDGVFRSIEEHYLRKAGSRDANFVRNRLDNARNGCDFSGLAAELMNVGAKQRTSYSLPRHVGIDDGPVL